VIDPRRTETCEGATSISRSGRAAMSPVQRPARHCRREGLIDEAYMAASVATPEGFWEAIDEGNDLWSAAQACDVTPADLQRFFDLFAANPRTVTMFSQGINQSIRGTDQVNAIINVHLATGRIGKPGAAPFSITGQPNAMGGREVGGLASTLAAHMDFAPENVERVRRFWGGPAVAPKPGLKAVDMFRAVREGRIKAIWIMATNPAVSMPDANLVREALADCPFVVVSDCIASTDTAVYAHVRLPAAGWGEKDGTVTNSERRISRQRPFSPARRVRTRLVDHRRRSPAAWAGPMPFLSRRPPTSTANMPGSRPTRMVGGGCSTSAIMVRSQRRLRCDGAVQLGRE
jgi:assimilatory nitrate reductase catalytic subunit